MTFEQKISNYAAEISGWDADGAFFAENANDTWRRSTRPTVQSDQNYR